MADQNATPPEAPKGWIRRLWHRYIILGLGEEEQASHGEIAEKSPWNLDWKLIGTFIVMALSMTLLEYFGKSEYYWQYVHSEPVTRVALDKMRMVMAQNPAAIDNYFLVDAFVQPLRDVNSSTVQLYQLLYWAAWCVLTYLIIPALWVVFVLRHRLRDYGLKFKGTLKHMWVYVVLFMIVLPTVILVSGDAHFQMQYPFYRAAAQNPRAFWIWEMAYAAQFFSLEFFFRGFMIQATKHRFGVYSIVMMMVPYCMIHYGKPMPETIGAILAGIVLGTLALRTGSIILGFMIHVSVALSMDLVSLWRQDQLGPIIKGLF